VLLFFVFNFDKKKLKKDCKIIYTGIEQQPYQTIIIIVFAYTHL